MALPLPIQELHFPDLNIPINIDRIEPVYPLTPHSRNTLYLSNLDDMIGCRALTPTVYFYRHYDTLFSSHEKPIAQTLRDSLRKVLVPYYPFSGRLRETENGKLELFFGDDQGALFVEAHSELSLSDLGDLTVPNPAWMKLVYRFSNEEQYKVIDMPLVIAQVTVFACGGFSLGLRTCHCLCDGFGAMQFLNAWARTTKAGSLVVNPTPCWDREIFRPRFPPMIGFPHTEFEKIEEDPTLTKRLWQGKLVQKCYKVSQECKALLKTLANNEGDGEGEFSCTGFDAMSAHVWRSWAGSVYDGGAAAVQPLLRLTFSVNIRAKLENPPLREGFYGNALCVACATSGVERLCGGRLAEAARRVHEARLGVSEEYMRSTIDYIDQRRPQRLEFGGKLTITQWTRFSIYEMADFGWGRPAYAGPIDLTPTPQVCMFLPEGEEADSAGGGATVICVCLPEFAVRRFGELLMHLS